MKQEFPLFQAVDIASDGKIHATFAIRQKTEEELEIKELQRRKAETKAEQIVQDGTIMELDGMI